MKKSIFLMISIVTLLTLTSCSVSINSSDDGIGNITAITSIANYNGWDYLRDKSNENNGASAYSLYKRKEGSNHKTKICDDDPYFISAVGDWIYYIASFSGSLMGAVKNDCV